LASAQTHSAALAPFPNPHIASETFNFPRIRWFIDNVRDIVGRVFGPPNRSGVMFDEKSQIQAFGQNRTTFAYASRTDRTPHSTIMPGTNTTLLPPSMPRVAS